MKRTGIVLGILLVMLNSSANAQDYKLGLGVRFSSKAALINNSVSFKYFFSETVAGEALFCFSDPLAFGLLVAKHKPLLANVTGFKYYFGAGAYAGFSGPRRAGLQGVLGLDYKISSIPFNLAIDWKPELTLTREVSFEPAALGLTARFTIK